MKQNRRTLVTLMILTLTCLSLGSVAAVKPGDLPITIEDSIISAAPQVDVNLALKKHPKLDNEVKNVSLGLGHNPNEALLNAEALEFQNNETITNVNITNYTVDQYIVFVIILEDTLDLADLPLPASSSSESSTTYLHIWYTQNQFRNTYTLFNKDVDEHVVKILLFWSLTSFIMSLIVVIQLNMRRN